MEKQAEEQIVDSQPSSKNILCDQCGETFQDSDLFKKDFLVYVGFFYGV